MTTDRVLPSRNLEATGAVGANLRRFPSAHPSDSFAGVPNLGKPLYMEKTVYIKTHKTDINRSVDHTGET